MTDIVITGGGITGLSAAYIAAKAGRSVTVLEAGSQFGGLLNTFETGNNRLEKYYHHFFTHDLEFLWLIRELGLDDKLFFEKTTMGIFYEGKTYPFQSAIDLLRFKPLGWRDKLLFGVTSLYLSRLANWSDYEGVSCLEWFRKMAGERTTRVVWQPMLEVKFGSYAGKVPLSWMIGRLRQRINSRKQGSELLGYMNGSMQVLVDALLSRLEEMGVELLSNSPAIKINQNEGMVTGIVTSGGEISGEKYLFTTPGFVLAGLLNEKKPGYAQKLKEIKYFGAICLVLEMKKPLSNYYWLNISDASSPFGGVIEHTNFVSSAAYGHRHIAYLSKYFAADDKIATMKKDEVIELMMAHLPNIFPDFQKTDITGHHFFRTNTAATVCDLHFSQKIPSCQTPLKNLFIANMSHVYPDERSMNNSIRVAYEALRVMGIESDYLHKSNSLSAKTGF